MTHPNHQHFIAEIVSWIQVAVPNGAPKVELSRVPESGLRLELRVELGRCTAEQAQSAANRAVSALRVCGLYSEDYPPNIIVTYRKLLEPKITISEVA